MASFSKRNAHRRPRVSDHLGRMNLRTFITKLKHRWHSSVLSKTRNAAKDGSNAAFLLAHNNILAPVHYCSNDDQQFILPPIDTARREEKSILSLPSIHKLALPYDLQLVGSRSNDEVYIGSNSVDANLTKGSMSATCQHSPLPLLPSESPLTHKEEQSSDMLDNPLSPLSKSYYAVSSTPASATPSRGIAPFPHVQVWHPSLLNSSRPIPQSTLETKVVAWMRDVTSLECIRDDDITSPNPFALDNPVSDYKGSSRDEQLRSLDSGEACNPPEFLWTQRIDEDLEDSNHRMGQELYEGSTLFMCSPSRANDHNDMDLSSILAPSAYNDVPQVLTDYDASYNMNPLAPHAQLAEDLGIDHTSLKSCIPLETADSPVPRSEGLLQFYTYTADLTHFYNDHRFGTVDFYDFRPSSVHEVHRRYALTDSSLFNSSMHGTPLHPALTPLDPYLRALFSGGCAGEVWTCETIVRDSKIINLEISVTEALAVERDGDFKIGSMYARALWEEWNAPAMPGARIECPNGIYRISILGGKTFVRRLEGHNKLFSNWEALEATGFTMRGERAGYLGASWCLGRDEEDYHKFSSLPSGKGNQEPSEMSSEGGVKNPTTCLYGRDWSYARNPRAALHVTGIEVDDVEGLHPYFPSQAFAPAELDARLDLPPPTAASLWGVPFLRAWKDRFAPTSVPRSPVPTPPPLQSARSHFPPTLLSPVKKIDGLLPASPSPISRGVMRLRDENEDDEAAVFPSRCRTIVVRQAVSSKKRSHDANDEGEGERVIKRWCKSRDPAGEVHTSMDED